MRRYDVASVGLLLMAATVYLTYAHLWAFAWQLKAYTTFVPVPATIVESVVRSTGNPRSSEAEMFQPHIVFHYRLDGQDYESERHYFGGGGWRDRSAAEAVVARYPVRSQVMAYVDDDHRSMAVLDRRRPESGVLLYLLPITAISMSLLAYGLRKRIKA